MKPDRDASSDQPITSIVHRSDLPSLPTDPEYIEVSVTSIRPSPVEAFLTPWGIASIAIFLLANSLLTWNQLLSKATAPSNTPLDAPAKTAALSLDNLAIVARPSPVPLLPSPVAVNPREAIVPIPARPVIGAPAAPVPVRPVVNSPRPAGDLTRALLPPAVLPTHTLDADRVRPSLPPPPESISIVGNPTATAPSPTPSPALMNERMLDELRRREESPANLPFYQREKARRTGIQIQRDAAELMKQLPPQLQIQPSPANGAPPAPTPAVPGEIIIEGR